MIGYNLYSQFLSRCEWNTRACVSIQSTLPISEIICHSNIIGSFLIALFSLDSLFIKFDLLWFSIFFQEKPIFVSLELNLKAWITWILFKSLLCTSCFVCLKMSKLLCYWFKQFKLNSFVFFLSGGHSHYYAGFSKFLW